MTLRIIMHGLIYYGSRNENSELSVNDQLEFCNSLIEEDVRITLHGTIDTICYMEKVLTRLRLVRLSKTC